MFLPVKTSTIKGSHKISQKSLQQVRIKERKNERNEETAGGSKKND